MNGWRRRGISSMASSSLPTSAAATIPCHAQDLFVASSSLPTSAAATIPCHAQDLFDGVIAISDLCRSNDPMTTSSGDGPQSSTLAAADRRVRAALDVGSKTRLPPVVRWELTAFLTTSDAVRDEAGREEAGGGSSCPRAEPRRREEGTRPDLSIAAFVPSSRESAQTKKMELVQVYEALYAK